MENEPPCPIGTAKHGPHDDRIRELETFVATVERTPRMLAERVIALEKLALQLEKQRSQAIREKREFSRLVRSRKPIPEPTSVFHRETLEE